MTAWGTVLHLRIDAQSILYITARRFKIKRMDAVTRHPQDSVIESRTPLLRSLRRPWVAGWIMSLSLLLALPSLQSSLIADDYYHAARFLAPGLLPDIGSLSPFKLFAVSDGAAATNAQLVAQGLLPWWTDDQFRFQLWRPLAEWSHWIDYRLWPASPWLMHAHHLLWFAALQWLVLQFYRRLFPASVALGLLTFALFVLSANFSQTVTWLAARNTLMGATFGIAALLLHMKSWQENRPRLRWLACGMFALALAASEFGLGASAWLFAWAMVMESGSLTARITRLLPYGIIMGLWLLLYTRGGYGVAESDYYLDPLQHPAGYVLALVQRSVDLLFTSVFGFSTAMLTLPTSTLTGWLVAAVGFMLVMMRVWHHWRERTFRFLLLGALLSLLPIAAGPGGARALAFVSLGITPFVAALLHGWLTGTDVRRLTRWMVWPLTICLAVGTLGRTAAAFVMPGYDDSFIRSPSLQLPIPRSSKPQRLILLNPSSVLHAILYPLARVPMRLATPPLIPLASGNSTITITRDRRDSLLLSPVNGFLTEPAAFFVRRKNAPFHVGDRLTFSGLQVDIVRLNASGRPQQVRFSFDHPLESPQLRFLRCEDLRFREFDLPDIGEKVVLPPCRRAKRTPHPPSTER